MCYVFLVTNRFAFAAKWEEQVHLNKYKVGKRVGNITSMENTRYFTKVLCVVAWLCGRL